jgi:hypothetical protein
MFLMLNARERRKQLRALQGNTCHGPTREAIDSSSFPGPDAVSSAISAPKYWFPVHKQCPAVRAPRNAVGDWASVSITLCGSLDRPRRPMQNLWFASRCPTVTDTSSSRVITDKMNKERIPETFCVQSRICSSIDCQLQLFLKALP